MEMTFKNFIKDDVENVFLNSLEFADEHIIDRKKIKVVIDNDMLKERNRKEYDGIIQADLLYFTKKDDIKRPIVGEVQMFDGILYRVFDVKEDVNMYEVILQSNED